MYSTQRTSWNCVINMCVVMKIIMRTMQYPPLAPARDSLYLIFWLHNALAFRLQVGISRFIVSKPFFWGLWHKFVGELREHARICNSLFQILKLQCMWVVYFLQFASKIVERNTKVLIFFSWFYLQLFVMNFLETNILVKNIFLWIIKS